MPKTDPYRVAMARLRPPLGAALSFSALVNLLMLTGSIYMLQVYDRVLTSGSVPTLLGLFAIVVVLYAFLCLYDVLRRRLLSRAALHLDGALGGAAFDQFLASGLPESAGKAQPLQDLKTLRGTIGSPALVALIDLPFVPLFLGVLFMLHPWLGWLTLAGAGVTGAIALINRLVTGPSIAESGDLEAEERAFTEGSRRAAETITAMGMTGVVDRVWLRMHSASLAAAQRGAEASETLAAMSRSVRMLLQSAILTLGAYLVLQGQISGGMIIAASILSGRALAPVDQVIGQWRSLDRALQAHRRLRRLFATLPAAPEPVALPDPTGEITVTGVTKFAPGSRGPDRPRLLEGIDVTLHPGDGLGVIGKSGSGKSTLARVLAGAWQADTGEVRIDGATLSQWDPARIGREIGYLSQSVEILPGTIRDTIARLQEDATDEAVIAAARLAGIHEMILQLPQGYATQIGGAAGMPLSGGQLQRLGLARALYGMPRLVILDEPNSNLDAEGEEALTRAIRALRAAGSVVIAIAHRPSALAALNKLLLLEAGRVAQIGDKDEVLAASGAVRPSVTRTRPVPLRLPLERRVGATAPAANQVANHPGGLVVTARSRQDRPAASRR
ncbi:type I secretion system permease/ATPase [Pseudoroseicyclus aestuarii]|uniref:ATP-binding cassette subfamily C protein n=1 Tax=Pseudoroseicyclus aestuarii TaxID=1795041 RepID=A0A318T4M8_9RHOB|nr:type I secretion system permease/ATPase [Pseudoroseicyclus aestuarii]PYE82221.1 ATP-binding cassette subfamily C protein [Pseudoroseicyclus aestuarii]